ncbi:hypothetical protein H0H81_001192 [Sphagnurus paluster]|uniref:Uncharacterized protein n=1 Tax=Sphagnurus paluster TaxID=117069 RepID=A0A9P7GNF6_9AGAR|nr:hypothetical protein H0H81_001192 [Sphagnurus paluster]
MRMLNAYRTIMDDPSVAMHPHNPLRPPTAPAHIPPPFLPEQLDGFLHAAEEGVRALDAIRGAAQGLQEEGKPVMPPTSHAGGMSASVNGQGAGGGAPAKQIKRRAREDGSGVNIKKKKKNKKAGKLASQQQQQQGATATAHIGSDHGHELEHEHGSSSQGHVSEGDGDSDEGEEYGSPERRPISEMRE